MERTTDAAKPGWVAALLAPNQTEFDRDTHCHDLCRCRIWLMAEEVSGGRQSSRGLWTPPLHDGDGRCLNGTRVASLELRVDSIEAGQA